MVDSTLTTIGLLAAGVQIGIGIGGLVTMWIMRRALLKEMPELRGRI